MIVRARFILNSSVIHQQSTRVDRMIRSYAEYAVSGEEIYVSDVHSLLDGEADDSLL